MLRGWKSARCSAFLRISDSTGGAVIEVVGILPVTKSIPIPLSHRLRSAAFIDPPIPVHFSCDSSISFTFACQSGIKLRVQLSLEANTDFDDASRPQANRTDQGTY